MRLILALALLFQSVQFWTTRTHSYIYVVPVNLPMECPAYKVCI